MSSELELNRGLVAYRSVDQMGREQRVRSILYKKVDHQLLIYQSGGGVYWFVEEQMLGLDLFPIRQHYGTLYNVSSSRTLPGHS